MEFLYEMKTTERRHCVFLDSHGKKIRDVLQ